MGTVGFLVVVVVVGSSSLEREDFSFLRSLLCSFSLFLSFFLCLCLRSASLLTAEGLSIIFFAVSELAPVVVLVVIGSVCGFEGATETAASTTGCGASTGFVSEFRVFSLEGTASC